MKSNTGNKEEPATAQISLNEIQQGNVMVNFPDEYNHGRFYKAKNVAELRNRGYTLNPVTRQPVLRRDLQTYTASVDGTLTGTHVPPNFNTLYPSPANTASTRNIQVQFKTLTGTTYTAQFTADQPISDLVKRFGELRDVEEKTNFVEFVGLPFRERDQYLVFPFLGFRYGTRVISRDLIKTLGEYVTNEDNIIVYVFNRISYYGTLGISYEPPPFFKAIYNSSSNSLNNSRNINTSVAFQFQEKWKDIRNIGLESIVNKFKTWLTQHPDDYSNYTKSQFSSALLTYIEELEKEATEQMDTAAQEYVDEYMKTRASRPSNRRNRRKTRKNRRS